MTAKELFDYIIKRFIEETLGAYTALVSLVETIVPGSEYAEKISSIEMWRPFLPPVYNYVMTAIEVYLEQLFFENYKKGDGTHYKDSNEWFQDFDNFKSQVQWESTNDCNLIQKGFSFQRLDKVNILYKNTFGFRLDEYERYSIIKFMFQKRHLFTHKAGIIDKKYLELHNAHHHNNPEQIMDESKIGMQAYLEMPWLYASIEEAKNFINWIESQKDL